MPFVTRLRFSSGDRAALESVVEDVRAAATRKGVALKGPHSPPPERLRVPLYRRLTGEGGRFDDWGYAVYAREVEIVGREEFAREVAGRGSPASVHVEVAVDRVG